MDLGASIAVLSCRHPQGYLGLVHLGLVQDVSSGSYSVLSQKKHEGLPKPDCTTRGRALSSGRKWKARLDTGMGLIERLGHLQGELRNGSHFF